MPWSSILEILLKLLGWGLDRAKASAEAKLEFLAFVDAMASHGLIQMQLNQSDRAQVDELRRRRAEAASAPKP